MQHPYQKYHQKESAPSPLTKTLLTFTDFLTPWLLSRTEFKRSWREEACGAVRIELVLQSLAGEAALSSSMQFPISKKTVPERMEYKEKEESLCKLFYFLIKYLSKLIPHDSTFNFFPPPSAKNINFNNNFISISHPIIRQS